VGDSAAGQPHIGALDAGMRRKSFVGKSHHRPSLRY
jgi:hypothetical protein